MSKGIGNEREGSLKVLLISFAQSQLQRAKVRKGRHSAGGSSGGPWRAQELSQGGVRAGEGEGERYDRGHEVWNVETDIEKRTEP